MSELKQIHDLYAHLIDVREMKEKAQAVADEYAKIAAEHEKSLGDLFSAYGLTSLKMEDGKTVTLKTDYYGTVSEEKIGLIREFLERSGNAGILKPKNLTISEKDIEELPANLRSRVAYAIHAQTLKSTLKEMDEAGQLTPEVRDLFAVHQINKVVLK